mgnify:CR=1 FL=1
MSLRKAIDAKCRECIYDESSGGGNWRQQVTACTAKTCPLYWVRPVSVPKGLNRSQVLKDGQNGPSLDKEAHGAGGSH